MIQRQSKIPNIIGAQLCFSFQDHPTAQQICHKSRIDKAHDISQSLYISILTGASAYGVVFHYRGGYMHVYLQIQRYFCKAFLTLINLCFSLEPFIFEYIVVHNSNYISIGLSISQWHVFQLIYIYIHTKYLYWSREFW